MVEHEDLFIWGVGEVKRIRTRRRILAFLCASMGNMGWLLLSYGLWVVPNQVAVIAGVAMIFLGDAMYVLLEW